MNQRRACINDRQIIVTIVKLIHVRVAVSHTVDKRGPQICGAQRQRKHVLNILRFIDATIKHLWLLREQLCQTEAHHWIINFALVEQYLEIAFDILVLRIRRWDAQNALEVWQVETGYIREWQKVKVTGARVVIVVQLRVDQAYEVLNLLSKKLCSTIILVLRLIQFSLNGGRAGRVINLRLALWAIGWGDGEPLGGRIVYDFSWLTFTIGLLAEI